MVRNLPFFNHLDSLFLSILRTSCMQKNLGFTLIELIIVIILLGTLSAVAAPKFIDLSGDAEEARFRNLAANFKSGVDQVHMAWQIRGQGKAQQDFIDLSGDADAGGDLSVNKYGFPADTRGRSKATDSDNDCLDVFRAVLVSDEIVAAAGGSLDDATYSADLGAQQSCTYTFLKQDSLSFTYYSWTGEVVIN